MADTNIDKAFDSIQEELNLNRRFRARAVDMVSLLKLDGEQFIHWLYVAILDRQPDAPGRQSYLYNLNEGAKTKTELILHVRRSAEGRSVGKILYAVNRTNIVPLNSTPAQAEAICKLAELEDKPAPKSQLLPEKTNHQFLEWIYTNVVERYPSLDEEQSALANLNDPECSRHDFILEFTREHFLEISPDVLFKVPADLIVAMQTAYLVNLTKHLSQLKAEIQEGKKARGQMTMAIADFEATLRTFRFAFSLQDRLLDAMEKLENKSKQSV